MNRDLQQPALQNLADGVACGETRQRLGVRQSSAAFLAWRYRANFQNYPSSFVAELFDHGGHVLVALATGHGLLEDRVCR